MITENPTSPKEAHDSLHTEELLQERGKRYGSFSDNARVTQNLKTYLRVEIARRQRRGQSSLTHVQIEALEMIAGKISRIICGDPNYEDNWNDIAGYAKLGSQVYEE